ncbi:hypothetical protein [Clostridium sp. MD294]|uniref:hypothetical protein n=1 Tax=Clostridium sp. MD294 TaxID=97138 RepID=UPI0002C9DCD5|nr:hypothetical protein [Clostridium sp. MD294]NDO47514.1 hypothetical protein [Clostridium sp. MD294]USF29414.1 hypothetical protein C820_000805 [Clostridium sp. MD294]
MKFAEIQCSTKIESFGIPKIFLKLPHFILNWYLLQYRPFCIKEMNLANAEGYEIKIYQNLEQQTEKQIQKLLLFLKQKEVAVVLTDCDIILPNNIKICYGTILNSLLVLQATQKAIKRQHKTLQESRFLIIDGENFITDLVLDVLYPHVNYLSIYTNRQEYFTKKTEQIYEDYGLCLEFFTGEKNKLFGTYNVIINCSNNMDNYDYKIQKNAFYFDIIQNKPKMKRLLSRRNDLLLSDGLLLKWQNNTYYSKQLETIFCATEKHFYYFLCHDYRQQSAQEIIDLLQQKEIIITGLTCFEKRI